MGYWYWKRSRFRKYSSAVSIILDFFEDKKIDCPILYGGSVSKSNIEEIISIPGIDGCLVGNSSLDGNNLLLSLRKLNHDYSIYSFTGIDRHFLGSNNFTATRKRCRHRFRLWRWKQQCNVCSCRRYKYLN